MIEIAFRHGPWEVLASLKVLGRVQGEIDRGWQDKSRKVRPVGRLGNVRNINHAANIAKLRHSLSLLPRCWSSSAYNTLRLAK
jgi:hypothetical protein